MPGFAVSSCSLTACGNVNPMILPVGDHHEIVNQPGRTNSDVMPSVPPKPDQYGDCHRYNRRRYRKRLPGLLSVSPASPAAEPG
jgi:hypothetical protein